MYNNFSYRLLCIGYAVLLIWLQTMLKLLKVPHKIDVEHFHVLWKNGSSGFIPSARRQDTRNEIYRT